MAVISMREKIARAIVASDFDGDESVWSTMSDEMRENFYRSADAALDALMEPSEEMISAGVKAIDAEEGDCATRYGAAAGFLAMIQAAKDGC